MQIPHSRPSIDHREADAAGKVILSGDIAQGKEVTLLESELCKFTGHRYGVAFSSGTASLYMALKALRISAGASVMIPSFACTALANAVFMTGAKPVLCDVEDSNGLMSVATVRRSLVKSVKAIIVPHLFGHPADAYAIEKEIGIPVIEDCAQCIGASINGKPAGSLSSIATFSFYATKVIAAGEGGMVTTSDKKIATILGDMREYDNKVNYTPSFNLKCSDIHAAIARVQLQKLPLFIRRRRQIATAYNTAVCKSEKVHLFPAESDNSQPIYYRYIVRLRSSFRNRLIAHLKKSEIAAARPIFKPFHSWKPGKKFPVTDSLYKELVSIPLYPSLGDNEINRIVKALLSF